MSDDLADEARRVIANKTRSHVSAARELAFALLESMQKRDELESLAKHWEARALVAEASLARLEPRGTGIPTSDGQAETTGAEAG